MLWNLCYHKLKSHSIHVVINDRLTTQMFKGHNMFSLHVCLQAAIPSTLTASKARTLPNDCCTVIQQFISWQYVHLCVRASVENAVTCKLMLYLQFQHRSNRFVNKSISVSVTTHLLSLRYLNQDNQVFPSSITFPSKIHQHQWTGWANIEKVNMRGYQDIYLGSHLHIYSLALSNTGLLIYPVCHRYIASVQCLLRVIYSKRLCWHSHTATQTKFMDDMKIIKNGID